RLLLRWYINPIVDQQNDFNAAAVRALHELAAGQEALRREVESGSRAVGQSGSAPGESER
ncbi:MAG TPA: hypothetical protein VFW96_20355, partial [Thermomicrobiales bacterium]|nr:hypothetical protein [Thermomicrobiales bacterium]